MYIRQERVRYSEMNAGGVMTVPALLNYYQDCCSFQSEDLGVGVAYLREHHQAWVLAGWNIEIDRMPSDMEPIEVATWPYEFKGFYGYRNFTMKDADGKLLSRANSCWIYMDLDRGRPCRVPEDVARIYAYNEPLDMELPPRRMALPEGGMIDEMPEIPVQSHHLDTNHHVNNGQYVAIASEYLPEDFVVKRILVEYKKAAVPGDIFCPRVAADPSGITVSLDNRDRVPYAVVKFAGAVLPEKEMV